MRLKSIKLAGFKSFVDPTTVPFPDAMTAIVGPNGCGKSNIIDAVRWVLGESSAKNLRGDAMTDVIFNGSSARKPVSQASVELVFDNTSGRVQGEYANYNEISVKRMVTREPVSSYFLNGSKCRRRDITDIFLGTGLGPRSYAIIEQGMISRLIESKPQELRVFIEEAAGISKYKERRRETENRIKHTNENLDRLEDVRSELGQQLEKLQRQASAAKRYKELKALERKLKSELCVVRWLKMTEQLTAIESQVKERETALEAFIAQQRGGELDLVKFKEQQAECKNTLAGVQQQFYQVGNEITRLEQNMLHGKQRKQKIAIELEQLAEQQLVVEQQVAEERELLAELSETIEFRQPEVELLEEQLLQAEESLESAEGQLLEINRRWEQLGNQASQSRQQSQICSTRLQSLKDLEIKSTQRVEQLQIEISELNDEQLAEDLVLLDELATDLQHKLDEKAAELELLQQQIEETQTKAAALQDKERHYQGLQQTLLAEKTSLETLQQQQQSVDVEGWKKQQNIEAKQLWQALKVEQHWLQAVELVLGGLLQGLILAPELDCQTALLPGMALIENSEASNFEKLSLAAKVTEGPIPEVLVSVICVEDLTQAVELRKNLSPDKSVITADGHWLGSNWHLYANQSDDSGSIARAQRIDEIEQQHTEIAAALEQLNSDGSELQQELHSSKEQLNQISQRHGQLQQQLTECQTQQQVKQQQQNMLQGQSDRLERELQRQQEALEQEQEQQVMLIEEIAELDEQSTEFMIQQESLADEKLQSQQGVETLRAQKETIKGQQHQLALSLQEVKTRYQGLQHTLQRSEQQVQQVEERKRELIEEQQQSGEPLEEIQLALEELLERRVELEQQQTHWSDALADVESTISDIEKGHHGIMDKIQQQRSELESLRLEGESFRVRANTHIEQLAEMGESLMTLQQTLDPNAEEQAWQQQLDKTTNSISRLGAINLAAIEEYEVQSERKNFLDTQHQDLAEALETLENAIRKIDRETRAKFKETFEQVNGDLMMLFPKVFGGGSAYLELTDSDMLDTGVTIMARPPGKKNSTIHLLSGGEKALTALSLVFAIFRLNPAPFCMLDEVDAPLDDANVGRFCRLVSEMSETVQFIYISHNKIAMEMANHLTGVTMHEAGVSRMVAVDIDEAVALAEM